MLPVMLVLAVVAIVGLVVGSEVVFGVGAVGVLACGIAWRWT